MVVKILSGPLILLGLYIMRENMRVLFFLLKVVRYVAFFTLLIINRVIQTVSFFFFFFPLVCDYSVFIKNTYFKIFFTFHVNLLLNNNKI